MNDSEQIYIVLLYYNKLLINIIKYLTKYILIFTECTYIIKNKHFFVKEVFFAYQYHIFNLHVIYYKEKIILETNQKHNNNNINNQNRFHQNVFNYLY